MQMQTVPTSLIGASLGEAHKWVREQMVLSNPGKPMADYTLTNQDGKAVSLSDLTKGRTSHVTIVGAGSTVRKNPAHPAEIAGFMEIPKPMHRNRLSALTQDDITPALYNAMVNEFGLFGATQTLSILLTRPVSPSLHHTQKTTNLIRARKGESLLPLHRYLPARQEKKKQQNQERRDRNRNSRGRRTNPRPNPTPAEATNAAVALGLGATVPQAAARLGRAGGLNLSLDKTTQDIRREVDRMLDNAEDAFQGGEAGALVSVANRMSIKYENSEEIFRNFAQNVLSPYLITSTANTNALKYINEYILPAMRDIVGSSDKKRRKLDTQYRYIVNKLATDPKDFYMGTELALIAHPGFLFPRAGLALMPVPENTRSMAFRAFQQAGTPPTYDPNTGFIATIAPSDRSGVAYLNQNTFQQINSETFAQGRNINRVSQVIDSLINVIERYGETDSTGFNVLKRDTQSMARMAGNELYERIAGMPAFYFTDLPGIRPIPTNWPQQLILAMMETLAKNRDRITGLGGGPFDAEEFLTPSGINLVTGSRFGDFENYATWLAEYLRLRAVAAADANHVNSDASPPADEENPAAERLFSSLAQMARANNIDITTNTIAGAPITPLTPAGADSNAVDDNNLPLLNAFAGDPMALVMWGPIAGGAQVARGAYPSFADFLDNVVTQNLNTAGSPGPVNGAQAKPGCTVNFSTLLISPEFEAFTNIVSQDMMQLEPITAQRTSASPSVYEIMVDTVELSMRKYNYNPSKDDIYFSTILLYYSLREMGLDAEVNSFMDRVAARVQEARNASLNRFRNDIAARYGAPAPGGGAINLQDLNNYLALVYAYEAFNDPTSDAFRALTGVRVNPAPVVTDTNVKNIRESLKKSIQEFEEALKRTGKDTNAKEVVEAMRNLVLPSLISQMNSDPKSIITYAGKLAEPSAKLIEAVNDLFGECEAAVNEHINALSMLARDMTGAPKRGATPADDVIESLTMLKGTTSKLSLLDRTATAMDDMVKFLPDSTTTAEKAYITSMKDFMTIIGDNIQFNNERIEVLVKGINKNKTDFEVGPDDTQIRPFPILSTLLDELNEMRQVVAALDTSVDVFDDYSTRDAEATVKYSNFASSSTTDLGDTLSNTKRMLVDAYSVTLEAMEFHGLGRADAKKVLLGHVSGKTNIPIMDQSNGTRQPNPFDSFVRGANSNVLVQALHKSADLEIVGLAPGPKLKEFQALFEVAPRYGEVLLDFFSEIYDDVGFAKAPIFEAKRDRVIKAQVDALYKKYQQRSKLGQAQKLLKADTFALLKATGSGIKATFSGLGTATGATVGAFGGAAAAIAPSAMTAAAGLTMGAGQAIGGAAQAAGGIASTAGGAVLGTGAQLGGALAGTGAALGGAALGTGAALGGAALGTGLAAGGTALGTGAATGGAAIGAGSALAGEAIRAGGIAAGAAIGAGGEALGAGIGRGGAALGIGLEKAGAAIATGLLFSGEAIKAGALAGSAAAAAGIGKGITILGFSSALALNAASTTYMLMKTRRQVKEEARTSPQAVQAQIDLIEASRRNKEAKLIEKETDRRVAITRKEEQALQMEVNMLDLGARRLRLLQIQAKAEANAARSDAEAAEARRVEAELNVIEERLELEAQRYADEYDRERRAFEREQARLDREEARVLEQQGREAARALRVQRMQDLEVSLRALETDRKSFLSGANGETAALKNKKPMKGEFAAVWAQYPGQKVSERLVAFDNDIASVRNNLKKLKGGR